MEHCLENSYLSLVIGHWSLVLSVVVGAASRREVLVIGHLQRTKDKGQRTNKRGV
jgi:hypothetical protein